VVTHEELVKYGDQSALDALKRLPGVTVSGDSVRMRGLGNGYTQVLVNGERPPAGFSLETLSPESIEKIEVIRAATAEYSTQSIAGTVNVILRKAAAKNSGEVKLSEGGSPGRRAPGLDLGLSGKKERFSYTLGASLAHNDASSSSSEVNSAYAPGGTPTELRATNSQYHSYATRLNANSRLNWALGQGDSLAWQTFLNASRFHGGEDSRTVTIAGPEYPYPSLLGRFDGDSASLGSDVTLSKRLANGARVDTKIGLNGSHIHRGLRRWGLEGAALVLDRNFVSDIHDNGLTTTGKYVVPLIAEHAFVFGWDAGYGQYRQQDVHVDQALRSAPPVNANEGFDATVSRLALYAQDEWEIRSGWSAYLGARWEGLHAGTTGNDFAPTSARYSVFSPLMQTVWKIPGTKSDQLRLALTRTYRAPPLSRLVQSHFYTSFNTEVSPDFVGNPRLRPELATGLDAAYEHYFDGGGLFSLSATSREIRDAIRNTVTFDGTRWVSAPANQGRAHVRGVALETKLPLKSFGSSWPVELRANVSRNWSSLDAVPGPGNWLDGQPRWSANLGADYTGAAFSAGASFSFVSGGWTRTSVPESAYAGVTRDLEAYVLYKFDARHQVRFTASNLLATDRLNASRYADARGEQNSATTAPTWRAWRIQYEHKF
jgi:outer membrane receptor protein involved in Fe transport